MCVIQDMPGILKERRGSSPNPHQLASPGMLKPAKRATPGSIHSLYSIMSGLDTQLLRNLADGDVKATRRRDIASMLLVIMIPILALIALASVNFSVVVKTHQVVDVAKVSINRESEMAAVTLNLQIERGMTAMFLSSKGTNKAAYGRMLDQQLATDDSIEKITAWPEVGINVNNQVINSSNDLRASLQLYRNRVLSADIPFEYNIRFYTNVTHALMLHSELRHEMPSSYTVWKYMLANSAILRVSDVVGIQRALGSTFFTLCKFNPANFVWFMSLDGEKLAYFETAFLYCRECKEMYSSAADEKRKLLLEIETKKSLIGDEAWQENCTKYDAVTIFSNSQAWFEDVTDYISILVKVRLHARDLTIAALGDIAKSADTSLTSYSVVIIIISLCSLGIGYFYTMNVQKIVSSVRKYTLNLRDKSLALASEKKQTERLLHLMLPKAVADQLKQGTCVAAEHFDCVTVMFSDIVGFTKFASSVTPLQVVDVLNNLYGLLDDQVDKYDAYKVETIGDAYMIVSGAPQRNGDQHAMELAEVALAFIRAVVAFTVPHAPSYQIKMRIGLHSGPCEAGVVGVKMPRYCLFGTTVLIAGYMENTAKEMTVHISEATKTLLASNDEYEVEDRGLVLIKGQKRKTFWLLSGAKEKSKAGDMHHPHSNLEETCAMPTMKTCTV
ncbi:uncharacterized protein LOC135496178 [Lineus longissimus]|uniref:uncharacterized protein LOC135496178 n=1 Tax=Lineus longissimus TaxID=88925 RepID=UPI002B4D9E30